MQEFWFRDGRLLWRGNNGTGKSKVLALTLPFLLDGDLSPHRVEPDGDHHKRMEWNLLLGGRYDERLGYTWIEFGRVTEDGTPAFRTAGVALKAAVGRGIADRWFFTTTQRVGVDLSLLAATGTALTRDRLTEAIDGHGNVVRTAEQYRRMLDEHLFQLGHDRYASLLDLLIQLRQPQLSRRPDEKALSLALTNALAPLDPGLLADVAAGFHDLEQQREELAGLRDSRGHVERFLDRYRRYAAVAARRAARTVRSGQSSLDEMGRQIGAVRQELTEVRAECAAGQERLDEIEVEQAELQAVRDELTERPELHHLDRAEQDAQAAQARERRATRAVGQASADHDRRVTQFDQAHRQADDAGQVLRSTLDGANRAASDAGVVAGHQTATAALHPATLSQHTLVEVRRDLDRTVEDRERAVAQMRDLIRAAEQARAEETAARRRLSEREADRDHAGDAVVTAEEAVAAQGEALVAAWRRYAAECDAFTVPQPDETGLAEWATTLDGPDPAVAAVRASAEAAQLALAHRQAAARESHEQARERVGALEAERAELTAGVTRAPLPPVTRAANVRDNRPGAPLWQAVDFVPGLPAEQRAAVEAALQAAGLLDAWITPDGMLLAADTHDTVVVPGSRADRNLAEVLLPAFDHADPLAGRLTDPTVAGVLAGVALADTAAVHHTGVCVGLDGTFRFGPMHGRWSKPTAEYLGHGAREEARRRRLSEVEAELVTARAAVEAARLEIERLAGQQQDLAAQLRRHPSDQALRDAHAGAGAARRELARRESAVEQARPAVELAETRRVAAARSRDEAAADLGLPTQEERLTEVQAALGRYRTAAAELLGAARRHVDLEAAAASWAAEVASAQRALEEATTGLRDASIECREVQARLTALRESLGGTVEQLKQRLAATRTALTRLGEEQRATTKAHLDAVTRAGRAEGREQQLTADQVEGQSRRDEAVAAFRRFAGTGLLTVAAPEVPEPDHTFAWAADPTVRLARRVEAALSETDDSDTAWKRVQDDITRRFADLAEALTRHGHQAHAELREDRYVVTIVYTGRERTPAELAVLLGEESERRERELTAREQEVLQEHLVNDVAGRLHELIVEAETQVAGMNAELTERPTSTGMRLRLRWEPNPEGPEGLAEARSRLLRQDADLWSTQDRKAVSDFLQREIERHRVKNPDGTWAEHLRDALDYRSWHRFTIERWQDGRWRSAVGPASGGERVLTVSLPLFAAASAHYRSAHPHAPRLVLLDEAFAGVDDDARAKCLGLLAQFDLDVAMTSEREWGFYATVPGIATYQLVRRDGIDAVHVTAWEWDGRNPRQVRRPDPKGEPAAVPAGPAAAAPAAVPPAPPVEEGLF